MRILIKSYSILLAGIGLISMLFFFPSSQGCGDCLPYSLCGLAMLILGIGLFLLNNFARKCMLCFSCIFIGFFILETIWLIKTDHTGQGLVGMMLLLPIFIICLIGILFLLNSKTKKEFEHTTCHCSWTRYQSLPSIHNNPPSQPLHVIPASPGWCHFVAGMPKMWY